jgi:hypothetical protein
LDEKRERAATAPLQIAICADMKIHVLAVFAAIVLATPVAAHAQGIPSYAQPAPDAQDQQIQGRLVSIGGKYNLRVRDQAGYVDNVEMHQGTIINPTGLTLSPGMTVSIDGYNAGSYFVANEIDTPYDFYDGVPYYDGYPWWHWGAGVSLGFYFGRGGWWQNYGAYDMRGGIRVYNHGFVGHVRAGGFYGGGFHGGGFHGGGFHGGGFHGGGHH